MAAHYPWQEQCAAVATIRKRFGLAKAISYLVGEKFITCLWYAKQDPQIVQELPAFIACIKKIFSTQEIADFLKTMPRRRTFGTGPIDRTLLREALLP